MVASNNAPNSRKLSLSSALSWTQKHLDVFISLKFAQYSFCTLHNLHGESNYPSGDTEVSRIFQWGDTQGTKYQVRAGGKIWNLGLIFKLMCLCIEKLMKSGTAQMVKHVFTLFNHKYMLLGYLLGCCMLHKALWIPRHKREALEPGLSPYFKICMKGEI